MDTGAGFWNLTLLIICIVGAKRIGKWDGKRWDKVTYRVLLIIVSTALVFFFTLYVNHNHAFEYPLFYILLLCILLHLYFNKPARLWIESGISPFSKEYPKRDWVNWKDQSIDEKLFLTGLLTSAISWNVMSNSDGMTSIIMLFLFWSGIFFIFGSLAYKYSQFQFFIGPVLFIISIWIIPFNSSIGSIGFYLGGAIIIWGLVSRKRKYPSDNKSTIKETSKNRLKIQYTSKNRLFTGEYKCTNCGALVKENSIDCFKCGFHFQ